MTTWIGPVWPKLVKLRAKFSSNWLDLMWVLGCCWAWWCEEQCKRMNFSSTIIATSVMGVIWWTAIDGATRITMKTSIVSLSVSSTATMTSSKWKFLRLWSDFRRWLLVGNNKSLNYLTRKNLMIRWCFALELKEYIQRFSSCDSLDR